MVKVAIMILYEEENDQAALISSAEVMMMMMVMTATMTMVDGGNNDIKNDQVAYHPLKCGFPIHFHVHFPTYLMVSEGHQSHQ